ncbi:MAG TPA: twin transmembrane helix small protein [Caulobacteraceae bacterium]|jgi:hypothetical protein
MRAVLYVILALALLSVLGTLAMGFYALFRGGEFGRAWSNKLMRMRVGLQLVAIIVLAIVVTLAQHTH